MEFLRYVIVFFAVGLGTGVIGGLLFLLLMPVLSRLRGTQSGIVVVGTMNGAATMLAVYVSYIMCGWTGGEASYLMYAIAAFALISNDLSRISRFKSAYSIAGEIHAKESDTRAAMVRTEQMNFGADLVGFAIGLLLIPRLDFI